MKALLEELRVEKDKNQKLREANKNFDKASKLLDSVFDEYQLRINYKKTETMILNHHQSTIANISSEVEMHKKSEPYKTNNLMCHKCPKILIRKSKF